MSSSPPTLFSIGPAVRERVRQAIRACEAEGTKSSARAVSERAKAQRRAVCLLLRLVRDGVLSLETSWDDSLSADDLARRIDEATTDDLRAQLCNDVARGIFSGQIPPAIGRAMGALIGEARLCGRNAREDAPSGEAEPTYLLSRAGITLGRLLDGIVSDATRSEVIAFAEAAFRRDVEAFPNPTPAEVEGLRREASGS